MKSPSQVPQPSLKPKGYPIIANITSSTTTATTELGSVTSWFPNRATSPVAIAETDDHDQQRQRQRHKKSSAAAHRRHHPLHQASDDGHVRIIQPSRAPPPRSYFDDTTSPASSLEKQKENSQLSYQYPFHYDHDTKRSAKEESVGTHGKENARRLGLIQPGVLHVTNDGVQRVSTGQEGKKQGKGKIPADDKIHFLEPGAVNVVQPIEAIQQTSKSGRMRLIQPSRLRTDDGDDAIISPPTPHSDQVTTSPEKDFDTNPIMAELAPEEDMTDRVTRQVTDEVTERLRKQFEQANSPDNALVIEGVVPEKDTFLCGLSLRTWIVGLVLVVPIVAGVVLGVVVLGSNSTPTSTSHPTQAPTTYHPMTLPPTNERRVYLMDVMGTQIAPNNATAAPFHDPNTPQYQAMQWLSEDDEFSSDLESMNVQLLLERYVMAVLYYSTSGPDWLVNIPFLNTTTSVCEWNDDGAWNNANTQGAFCIGSGENGFVTNLRLQEMGLSGTIPWELSLLKNLYNLYLGDNLLTGTVPNQLGSLSNLEELQAYGNSLSGQIPAQWGSRLEMLWFTSNYLSGTLPSELEELSSTLRHLQFGSNNLHGTICTELGGLTSLTTLELASNDMGGTIPTELGMMVPMMFLSLEKNVLTGTLPSEIGQLSSMLKLSIFDNDGLSGTVPVEYSNLGDLLTFAIEETSITGSLDSVFCPLDTSSTLEIYADCSGQNPEVECSCCYYCCTSDGSDCDYI